jgi:hypothetical protein
VRFPRNCITTNSSSGTVTSHTRNRSALLALRCRKVATKAITSGAPIHGERSATCALVASAKANKATRSGAKPDTARLDWNANEIQWFS